MSEERPAEPHEEPRVSDADAWATACAEDPRPRRPAAAPPTARPRLRRRGTEEARGLGGRQAVRPPVPLGALAGPAAQQMVKQVVQQAKAAVEPVIERNPGVFDHLAAAGGELLAAYRSAVQSQEQRWTAGPGDVTDEWRKEREGDGGKGRDRGEGTGSGERIDLD